MSKIYGLRTNYTPIRQDASRTVVSYGLNDEPDGIHATWHEVYWYKRRDGIPDLARIRQAVIADINERTRQRIVSTLTWNGKPVWLSIENQMDWKAAYDNAVRKSGESLPVKLKLGEQEDGTPVYHTFTSLNAFGDFDDTWQQHIMQCLADGYALKDGIDWSVYGTEEGTGEGQGE